MIKNNWGRILNIGSGAAHRAHGLLAYGAAKHGLVGYTRSLAQAVARFGINVNVLNPGWTATALIDFDNIGKGMRMTAEQAENFARREAIQNRIVQPDELAPMAVLLCSDAASAITGQMINVDGGFKV